MALILYKTKNPQKNCIWDANKKKSNGLFQINNEANISSGNFDFVIRKNGNLAGNFWHTKKQLQNQNLHVRVVRRYAKQQSIKSSTANLRILKPYGDHQAIISSPGKVSKLVKFGYKQAEILANKKPKQSFFFVTLSSDFSEEQKATIIKMYSRVIYDFSPYGWIESISLQQLTHLLTLITDYVAKRKMKE
jgi:hypothetical protein